MQDGANIFPVTHPLWLGTLEAGKKQEIVLIVLPTGGEDLKSCARVQFEHGECVVTKIGGQPAPPPALPPTPPAGEPKLTLQKLGPKQAILHHPLDYRLVVTNGGTAEVRGVTLTDTMDEVMRHAASQKSQLTWDVGTLAPGGSRTFDYQVITTKTGKLINRAVATAGTRQDPRRRSPARPGASGVGASEGVGDVPLRRSPGLPGHGPAVAAG